MNAFVSAVVAAMAFATFADSGKAGVSWRDKSFLVNGKPVQIRAGELDPQRIPRTCWRHRVRMCKAMGLNAISSYFMWNGFERPDGTFDFSTGNRDVAAFLRICHEEGMWVLFRPGPYVCGEWDFGGLPSRLLKDDVAIRSADPRYLSEAEKYLDAIAHIAEPFLVKHGGPILLTQIENEYGSWPFKDSRYLPWLKTFWKIRGFGPFYMADGAGDRFLKDLIYPDPEIAVGFDPAKNEKAWAYAEKYNPGVPVLSAETYPGWLRHWGEGDWKPTDLRKTLQWFVEGNRSFCIFVAHGGTSFGFTAGANDGGPGGYKADLTSYDYGAPIDEQGRATPAYHDYRRILAKATGEKLIDVPEPLPATAFAAVVPRRIGNLRRQGVQTWTAPAPLFFEAVGQNQGLGVYRADVPVGLSGELAFDRMADYAQIFLDGRRLATVDRRLKREHVVIPRQEKPALLEIVVEAMGHINFSKGMCDDRKGLRGPVRIGDRSLGPWTMSFDPLSEASVAVVRNEPDDGLAGGRFRGTFELAEAADTNIDLSKWTKGTVYVNGHNLGRYWKIGPQRSLYCPAEFLKRGENTFDIIEMEQRDPQPICGVTHPVRPAESEDTANADNVW